MMLLFDNNGQQKAAKFIDNSQLNVGEFVQTRSKNSSIFVRWDQRTCITL